MPNINIGQVNVSAPTAGAVNSSSSTLVIANNDRVGLSLVNVSNSTIYLGLAGNTAVLGRGTTLVPNGGTWSMDEFSFNNGTINAIAHSNGNDVAIQEFTR